MYANDFINITSDFGFNYFMQDRASVIEFLNAVLPARIVEITECTHVSQSAPVLHIRRNTAAAILESTQLKASSSSVAGAEIQNAILSCAEKSIRYDLVCRTDCSELINVALHRANAPFNQHQRIAISQLHLRQNNESHSIAQHKHAKTESGIYCKRKQSTFHIAILNFPIIDFVDLSNEDAYRWIWTRLSSDCDSPAIQQSSNNACMISLWNFRKNFDNLKQKLSQLEKFTWLFANLGRGFQPMPEWTKHFERLERLMIRELKVWQLDNYVNESIRRKDILSAIQHREDEIANTVRNHVHEASVTAIKKLLSLGVSIDIINKTFSDKDAIRDAVNAIGDYET